MVAGPAQLPLVAYVHVLHVAAAVAEEKMVVVACSEIGIFAAAVEEPQIDKATASHCVHQDSLL